MDFAQVLKNLTSEKSSSKILTLQFDCSHSRSEGVSCLTRIISEIGFLDVDDGQRHQVRIQRLGLLGWSESATRIDGSICIKSTCESTLGVPKYFHQILVTFENSNLATSAGVRFLLAKLGQRSHRQG